MFHTGGILGLTDVDAFLVDSCGTTSPGKGLVLVRYRPMSYSWGKPFPYDLCSNGATVVLESTIAGLRIEGSVALAIRDTELSELEATTAQGRVLSSTLVSAYRVGPGVSVGASRVEVCGGFTSIGSNVAPAACAGPADLVDDSKSVFESPSWLDAIAPGTPELCPGDRRDHRGVARPYGAGCDIGGHESTVPFVFGQDSWAEGWFWLSALDINDAGIAVGMVSDETEAVRYHSATDEIEPLGVEGTAVAVNAVGAVVGRSPTASGSSDAFRWDPVGTTTWLDGIGGDGESAVDLDDGGRSVGWATTAGGLRQAVMWDVDGTATVLSSDGLVATATAINDTGTIVGTVGTGIDLRAVRWNASTGTRVDLTGQGGRAFDVNDAGLVAGSIVNCCSTTPVVWEPGESSPQTLGPNVPIGDNFEPVAHATKVLDDGTVVVTHVGAIEAGPLVQRISIVTPDRSELIPLGLDAHHWGLTVEPSPFVAVSPGRRHLLFADRCYECGDFALRHLDLVTRP